MNCENSVRKILKKPKPEDDPTDNGNKIKTQNTVRFEPQHTGPEELTPGYMFGKRVQETICLAVSLVLIFFNLYQLVVNFQSNNWLSMLSAVFLGISTADFFSGLLHWAVDSWGSIDVPILGNAVIRSFREHHIDPTALAGGDFIETNADFFALTIPAMINMAFKFMTYTPDQIQETYNWELFIFFITVFFSLTNQFHKWSHTYSDLPWYVTVLQDLHLILPKKHHRIHHMAPHETYFCLTTGWLDYPLDKINFWAHAEHFIVKATGVKPRVDDMAWGRRSKKTMECEFENQTQR